MSLLCKQHISQELTYNVKTVDTTGAEILWGAMLYSLISNNKEIMEYSAEELRELIRFSNAAGSLTTTRTGAINAMPEKESILNCIKNVPYLTP